MGKQQGAADPIERTSTIEGMRTSTGLEMTMMKLSVGLKIDPPTFNDVHNPKVFNDWLIDMDYYFDLYSVSEERKVWLARM